jgi:SAM-dependent methyltransferase
MISDWDLRAQADAAFYVFREARGDSEEFSESGRRDLSSIVLPGVELPRGATVVEIGCGIGRLTRELAPHVARLFACDISEEMLSRARARCAGILHIEFLRIDGDLAPVPSGIADFVFSHLVFQHVPLRNLIRRYLAEAFRTLKPGGVFRANVDGRSRQWWRRVLADSWSGVVFSESGWRRDLEAAGFEVGETSGAGTQYLQATARKPAGLEKSANHFEREGRQELEMGLRSPVEK